MTLPKLYMNEIRKITGYWGTYLPSDRLYPGALGFLQNGLFTLEAPLSSYAGYDPALHAAAKPLPSHNPVSIWQSDRVTMRSVQADANVPGGIAGGGIHVGFTKANSAVLISKGMRSQTLINMPEVRNLLYKMYEDGRWKPNMCLISEVRLVEAAWICFSTSSDQEADIKTSASVGPTGTPLDALTKAAVKADISTSWSDKSSAGYSTQVDNGGTPLFQALSFKDTFFGLGAQKLEYLKGAVEGFTEPSFGDPTAYAAAQKEDEDED